MPIASQEPSHLLPPSTSLVSLAPLGELCWALPLSLSSGSSCIFFSSMKFPVSTHDLRVPSCCMPSLAHSFSVSISSPVTFSWFLSFSLTPIPAACLFPPTLLQAPFSCPPFNSKYLSSTCYMPSTEFFTSLCPSRAPSHLISPSSPLVWSLPFVPRSISSSPTSSSTPAPSL